MLTNQRTGGMINPTKTKKHKWIEIHSIHSINVTWKGWNKERKRWFQWEHKQPPSSIWEWQEPDFLQERPDTDHIWYTLRKQKFLLWNINKILLNLTYILRNQKQKEISISGNIESVTHIEQLSHTWYKDFRKYVKKYFPKE